LLQNPDFAVVTISITASAFLRKMMRNIVASLVQVGRSKLSVAEFENVFKGGKPFCLEPAPPQGLFLVDVLYEEGGVTSFDRAPWRKEEPIRS
jgi:tRNA pseudouridine38-40 synthase